MKSKWIIISILTLAAVGMGYYVLLPDSGSPEIESTVNELPALSVLKTDGSAMSLRDTKGKVVLIFFNPDCDHCQREANQISSQKEIFRNHTVYFISTDSMQNIDKFAHEYNLIEKNFYFGQVIGEQAFKAMGPMPSVPVIFIYDNQRLVKKLEGEVALEEIMKFL